MGFSSTASASPWSLSEQATRTTAVPAASAFRRVIASMGGTLPSNAGAVQRPSAEAWHRSRRGYGRRDFSVAEELLHFPGERRTEQRAYPLGPRLHHLLGGDDRDVGSHLRGAFWR